ncbi:MAG: hypothetical protein J7578_01325 [Chitinophagaceae bacterium]|nr:hypothetical protein [Chitinophagaceae bacterium]
MAKILPSSVLQEHITKKDFLKFTRSFQKEEFDILGYLVEEKDNFLLICEANDFSLNGYKVICKDQVDEIRLGKFEKTAKKIYKAEGISTNFPPLLPVDLRSWQQLFSSLKKNDYHVIVECEQFEAPYFDMGAIMKANKDFVRIQGYDASGKISHEPAEIPYKDITTVGFLDRYSTIFRKYIK